MKICVDTNILLDVLTHRDPFYQDSAVIWRIVEQGLVEGYISAISVNNVFYISKKLQHLQYAQELVDKILKDFHIIPLDDEILKLARTLEERDYEVLIQYFSGIKSGSSYLITRNTRDFPQTGIEIFQPQEFLTRYISE